MDDEKNEGDEEGEKREKGKGKREKKRKRGDGARFWRTELIKKGRHADALPFPINRHDASLVDARDDAIWDETVSSRTAYLEIVNTCAECKYAWPT